MNDKLQGELCFSTYESNKPSTVLTEDKQSKVFLECFPNWSSSNNNGHGVSFIQVLSLQQHRSSSVFSVIFF